jgi:hypothetical protein
MAKMIFGGGRGGSCWCGVVGAGGAVLFPRSLVTAVTWCALACTFPGHVRGAVPSSLLIVVGRSQERVWGNLGASGRFGGGVQGSPTQTSGGSRCLCAAQCRYGRAGRWAVGAGPVCVPGAGVFPGAGGGLVGCAGHGGGEHWSWPGAARVSLSCSVFPARCRCVGAGPVCGRAGPGGLGSCALMRRVLAPGLGGWEDNCTGQGRENDAQYAQAEHVRARLLTKCSRQTTTSHYQVGREVL